MTNHGVPRPRKADREIVTVDVLEYASTSGDRLLTTHGLGPCIAAAVYNRKSQTGYLAHLDYAGMTPFFNFLSQTTGGQTDDLKAWLRGGAPNPHIPILETVTGRSAVFTKLGELGITNVDVVWNEEPDHAIDLVLDCSSGRLQTEITELNVY